MHQGLGFALIAILYLGSIITGFCLFFSFIDWLFRKKKIQSSTAERKVFCPKCGNQFKENSSLNFCTKCGCKFDSRISQNHDIQFLEPSTEVIKEIGIEVDEPIVCLIKEDNFLGSPKYAPMITPPTSQNLWDKLINSAPQKEEAETYHLFSMGDETFESLIKKGKYDHKNDWVTEERFPIQQGYLSHRTLVILSFQRSFDLRSEDILEEAERRGLKRPTYKDCFLFGAQHPEVQCQFEIVFFHEPVLAEDGHPSVLGLYRNGSARHLGRYWFQREWSPGYRFAFIEEEINTTSFGLAPLY